MVGDFESDFLEEEFHTAFGWLVEHGSTWCVIFSRKARHRLLCLGPAVVFNGCRLTPLPRKSDRIDAEVGDRSQSHTLRFGKCL